MIKNIKKFFVYIFESIETGFYQLNAILAKGFFFYFYLLSSFFQKIFHFKVLKKQTQFFKNKQNDPVSFLMVVLVFFIGVFLHTYLYVDKTDIKYVDNTVLERILEEPEVEEEQEPVQEQVYDRETYTNNEINLYRKYGQWDITNINFQELKQVNSDVVAWIMVDGTSVNYPIVKSSDNDYYLNHDIMKSPKGSGWTFMDFRNTPDLSDSNTIFYGHNLLNKTAFGSLGTVFTDKWINSSNHYIVVKTESVSHVYEVFSRYIIEPEVYYLQTNFYNESAYQQFLDTIKSRTNYDFGVSVTTNDKIITLSTCSDDNKGRKVIHAKMIQ